MWLQHCPTWPCRVSTISRHRPFSQSRAGISGPAVCPGKGAAIHSYIFWVLMLTTRPSPSNYDIIENDLKPNVRALLSEPVFTENSCLNRHLEGIRITFFMSQCVSVSLSVCKCAYMRGLAIWAPTQTISLFWKCSLKSLGVDRSQEQRGKWALASFLLSLRCFSFAASLSDGHSAGLQNSTWGVLKFGETKGNGARTWERS